MVAILSQPQYIDNSNMTHLSPSGIIINNGRKLCVTGIGLENMIRKSRDYVYEKMSVQSTDFRLKLDGKFYVYVPIGVADDCGQRLLQIIRRFD